MDPYRRSAVRTFLTRDHFFLSSIQIKMFGSMGDRMAVACYLVTENRELWADPTYGMRVAQAVSVAFEAPSCIPCSADRVPAVAIDLMEQLLLVNPDDGVREKAGRLLAHLRSMCDQDSDGG